MNIEQPTDVTITVYQDFPQIKVVFFSPEDERTKRGMLLLNGIDGVAGVRRPEDQPYSWFERDGERSIHQIINPEYEYNHYDLALAKDADKFHIRQETMRVLTALGHTKIEVVEAWKYGKPQPAN